MKNQFIIIFITLLFCTYIEVEAQIQTQQVNFQEGLTYSGVKFLDTNGILVLGSKDRLFGKDESIILFYDNDLNLINEIPVKNKFGAASSNEVIVSEDGKYIYYLEEKTKMIGNARLQYVTQIGIQGAVRNLDFNREEKNFGKVELSTFSDEKYLYFLSVDKLEHQESKNKDDLEIFLNRFDHVTFTHYQKKLNLPIMLDPKSTTNWEFLGFREGKLMIYNTNLDIKISKFKFTIAEFDQDGNYLNKIELDVPLKGKFIRPAMLVRVPEGKNEQWQMKNFDFHMGNVYGANVGGFGYLSYDKNKDEFYTYGLAGIKKFRPVPPAYDEVFIIKFNGEGKELLRIHHEIPEKMKEDKFYFKKHISQELRKVMFYNLPSSDNFRLIVSGLGNTYGFEFDQIGKNVDFFFAEYDDMFLDFNRMSSNIPEKSVVKKYINSKHNVKDKQFIYLPGSENEFLFWWPEALEIVKF